MLSSTKHRDQALIVCRTRGRNKPGCFYRNTSGVHGGQNINKRETVCIVKQKSHTNFFHSLSLHTLTSWGAPHVSQLIQNQLAQGDSDLQIFGTKVVVGGIFIHSKSLLPPLITFQGHALTVSTVLIYLFFVAAIKPKRAPAQLISSRRKMRVKAALLERVTCFSVREAFGVYSQPARRSSPPRRRSV